MSPYLSDYPRYAWQMLNGFRADGERRVFDWRQQDIAPLLRIDRPLRVLDVANGRLRPQYTLLRASGHEVYGIDLVNKPRLGRIELAYGLARRLYTWKLGVAPSTADRRTLTCGDVGKLPFPDRSFDLVTSVAAFEHFLDVPAVVAELWRVLRPGGVAWVCVHLFTCPSGGHNLAFTEIPLRTIPPGVDAWDHLRRRRLPFTVPLNEWRQHQYLHTFKQHFPLVSHYCAMREGEALLTPAIARELAAYSRDELTCGALVIVAQKAG